MLSKIKYFFKTHFKNILLFLIVFLLCLLSFAIGMLVQFYTHKTHLEIQSNLFYPMKFTMNIMEPFAGNMSINLGSGYAFMA